MDSFDVQIFEGNKALASALYHDEAAAGGKEEKFKKIEWESRNLDYKAVEDPVDRAIWLLEMTGAGISWDEKKYAKRHRRRVAWNINEGDIFLSKSGMRKCSETADGTLRIVLDKTGSIVDHFSV